MTLQPVRPVIAIGDLDEWRAWRKARKLQKQRERRRTYLRIDYYPSKAAQAVIYARAGHFVGGDYSSVIDALVLRGSVEIPE